MAEAETPGAPPLETFSDSVAIVQAVTNFQFFPDNGGYVLVLGARKLIFEAGKAYPNAEVEPVLTAYLSHAMLSDMARVMKNLVDNFEKTWGHIPMPGLDKPNE